MDINTGMKMTLTSMVTMANTAKTLGSGSLLVYGTPAMLLLVEKTAVALLEGHLDEGMTSVGTNLNVDHVSATPIGGKICCQVELVEIDRKRLVFQVEVTDDAGLIGKGTHERFIVQAEKFQQKANGKLQAK
ncbi:MAG: thioesterase family protein [Clostridiales bacterium]|nr:thioesterase family protein [Clostridiales bacterium]